MPRKRSTRWRRSSQARRSSRRRTTARFPHRGAIRGCGAAAMARRARAQEAFSGRGRLPESRLLPEESEGANRKVAFEALWKRTSCTTKSWTERKGAVLTAESDTLEASRSVTLTCGATYVPGPPCSAPLGPGHAGGYKTSDTSQCTMEEWMRIRSLPTGVCVHTHARTRPTGSRLADRGWPAHPIHGPQRGGERKPKLQIPSRT